jgi:hypothetical protein
MYWPLAASLVAEPIRDAAKDKKNKKTKEKRQKTKNKKEKEGRKPPLFFKKFEIIQAPINLYRHTKIYHGLHHSYRYSDEAPVQLV